MTDHENNRQEEQLFEAYLRGTLDEEQLAAFERRLAEEPALADRFDAYSRPDATLREGVRVESPDLRRKVKRRIRRRSNGRFFGRESLAGLMGSIALVVVLLGLVLFVLLGPFGLMSERPLTDETIETRAQPAETASEERDRGASSPSTDSTGRITGEEFEAALEIVRRGGTLGAPGRVSGFGHGASGPMFIIAYRVQSTRNREETGAELRLMLPDDDVIETDEGFEFTLPTAEAPQMLVRLHEFGARIERYRREVPHTERDERLFKVSVSD